MPHIELIDAKTEMNGKPVHFRNAKTVLNCKNEAFQEKCLCDGPTMNAGDACCANCAYCYVEAMMGKLLAVPLDGTDHGDVVIRRSNAVDVLRGQLLNKKGSPRHLDPYDTRVVYCSTTVDCAGNLQLARETAELVTLICQYSNWQVRLLSKFNLLPKVAEWVPARYHGRLIFGVSTGTLDNEIASAIEQGTAHVSKRIESLHWLQDRGFRTFGMICPSLPQTDYPRFAQQMADTIRVDRCEHVWAEVINLRGKSFTRTMDALNSAGLTGEAARLGAVCGKGSRPAWEKYARQTFEAHAAIIPGSKLKFLQYVTAETQEWWANRASHGAVLLGKHAVGASAPLVHSPIAGSPAAVTNAESVTSQRSLAAHKAWATIRARYSPQILSQRQRLAAGKAWQTRRSRAETSK